MACKHCGDRAQFPGVRCLVCQPVRVMRINLKELDDGRKQLREALRGYPSSFLSALYLGLIDPDDLEIQ